MNGIVIITCGRQKQSGRCVAAQMYTGSYHQLCMSYARHLLRAPAASRPSEIRIFSALYGILPLWKVIDPYERFLGQMGRGDREELQCLVERQARAQRYYGRPLCQVPVTVIGGADYARMVKSIWSASVQTPLAGVGGIGKQMAFMKAAIAPAFSD